MLTFMLYLVAFVILSKVVVHLATHQSSQLERIREKVRQRRKASDDPLN